MQTRSSALFLELLLAAGKAMGPVIRRFFSLGQQGLAECRRHSLQVGCKRLHCTACQEYSSQALPTACDRLILLMFKVLGAICKQCSGLHLLFPYVTD